TGVTVSLVTADTTTVNGLQLTFNFSPLHTYYDDINMQLTHVDTATTVTLMSGSGTDNSDICGPYTLSDAGSITFDAAAAAETTGSSCIPSGTYKPDNPLSAFNGQSMAGTWQLKVWDDASTDTGTLSSWSLSMQQSVPPCPNITVNPSNMTACQGGMASFSV